MMRVTEKTRLEAELRFSGFDVEWQLSNLSKLLKVKHGFAFKGEHFGNSGEYIVVTPGNFNPLGGFRLQGVKEKYYQTAEFPKEYILEKGDILTAMTEQAEGLIGSTIEIPESNKFLHNQRLGLFSINEGVDKKFISFLFQRSKIRRMLSKLSAGTKVRHISPQNIESIKVAYPNEAEQQKIANFLSAVDKKISLLKEKHVLLEQYKKGVMQKLFSQETRFKDEKGNDFPDWVKGTLGDLSNKVSNKNKDESVTAVLTNSAKSGIVNQTDYFKKDIANENNLGGYSIVEKNDFVYNPRISVLAPVGPIKRNHVGQGVMSPLYTVFRFKNEGVLDYLELYFETTQWHRYMNSIANIGARHDRMNILMGDFFNLPIPIPSEDEMGKIVGFIQSLNKKVDLVSQQLKQTQTFKKGLLQQMFV